MISYNKTWLDNLRLHSDLKKELEPGNITNAEFTAISAKYPVGFYSPNIFVRVGLFILTCIIVAFTDSLLSLLAAASGVVTTAGWVFFLGLLTYGGLELIVNNKHYRSGVDDALLFVAAGQFIAALAITLYGIAGFYLIVSALAFVLLLFLAARFADMLTSATCSIAFFAFIYFGCQKIGSFGLSTVPFVMMLASGLVYWLAYNKTNQKYFVNYKNCLIVTQLICLVTLYAADNYYIIQTLSDELNGRSGPIAFGPFFWAWTILLPFVYIYYGITKKEVILLRTGLLLVAAGAATFKTYFHILPTDAALTLIGAILLGVVYGAMKYLKTPKHGFTTTEPEQARLLDSLRIESLLVAKTFSHAPSAPTDDGVKFGGGDFGGGGSAGGF